MITWGVDRYGKEIHVERRLHGRELHGDVITRGGNYIEREWTEWGRTTWEGTI